MIVRVSAFLVRTNKKCVLQATEFRSRSCMVNSSSRLFASGGKGRPSYRARQKLLKEELGKRVQELDWDHYEFSIE